MFSWNVWYAPVARVYVNSHPLHKGYDVTMSPSSPQLTFDSLLMRFTDWLVTSRYQITHNIHVYFQYTSECILSIYKWMYTFNIQVNVYFQYTNGCILSIYKWNLTIPATLGTCKSGWMREVAGSQKTPHYISQPYFDDQSVPKPIGCFSERWLHFRGLD